MTEVRMKNLFNLEFTFILIGWALSGVVRGILKVEVKQKIYLAYVILNGIHEFTY